MLRRELILLRSRSTDGYNVAGDAGGLDVVLQVSVKIMVAGYAVFLAAFLVEADPQTAVLPVNVFNRHAKGRADAGTTSEVEN